MELVRRKQSRVVGRVTRDSILSRTTPVVEKWFEGEQWGDGEIEGTGTAEGFLRDQQLLLDDINHPSLAMIVTIISWADAKYGRDNIVLWKMDNMGAFTKVGSSLRTAICWEQTCDLSCCS